MDNERNVKKDGPGMLYLCATPIGNLEDITYRVLRVLSEADLIAAEDTRNSIKLLNHFEIKTPMTSYHEFNKYDKAKVLVDKILGGMDVAVITDAGTPGISDPGEELVKQCRAAGIRVTSLPGPAACITALTMSGRETRRFAFEAFLPADKNERKEVLAELACETRTMIIYEAPHRLTKTLAELQDTLGGDRQITICKELTKRYENSMEFTLESACEYYENNEPRGEYVLVIAGKSREQLKAEARKQWENMSVAEHVQMYDQTEAMTLGTRIVVMNAGVVQQVDTPQVLYDTPCNLFVAGFIGSPQMNFLDAVCQKKGDKVVLKVGPADICTSTGKSKETYRWRI